MKRLKVLTWHIHGSYLYYLAQIKHQIYLPYDESGRAGYIGRTKSYPWPENVIAIPASEVSKQSFDCIIYQSHENYLVDRWELLSDEQRRLPQLYLEHDPPREHPTETKHPVDDPNLLLVHVTHFNRLMWDNGRTPSCVIEHGVMVPKDVSYRGQKARGIVVVNNITKRGRRLGADLFKQACQQVPLDLVGMGWQEAGGLTEVAHSQLPSFMADYRFFYNPIRYTSLGLAICEALMIGMPVVGLATTELASVIENDVSGYIDTNHDNLVEVMQKLLDDHKWAKHLSQGARHLAESRFHIKRFVDDWEKTLDSVAGKA